MQSTIKAFSPKAAL